jgi:5-methylcytosine-specific restriction enzyme A
VPYTPARACAHPGCPELARRGRRCAEHAREVERRRGSAARRGYDKTWQAIRAAALARQPLCAECGAPATEVHHRDGRGPRGDNRPSNLVALCRPCHSKATVERDGGFGRPRATET